MYFEKDYLIKKINEYCKEKNIELSYEEKDFLSSQVSRKLDTERLLTFEEFVELLDHNEQLEQYKDIEFDDEIISIEECDAIEMIDFDVTGDRLFYANGILTHNSAVNNDDAGNDAVSDSMGSVMTADFIMFLLQNEEMKERNEIICKVTKNRLNGRTDSFMMNVDYKRMRFTDMVPEEEVETYLPPKDNLGDDFAIPGLVTPEKMKDAEDFANEEVKAIQDLADQHRNDTDFQTPKEVIDPMAALMKEMGLES